MKPIDYSLYLVTGRNLLPPNKDFFTSLEESIQGGVTIVQLREKELDTHDFVDLAKKAKVICDKYNIPLLINDRVDVALAANVDGVHVGQTDMPIEDVRRLLPPGSIVGLSCNTVAHVKDAVRLKVDYIGIGAVWGTQTKKLTQPIIGVRGVGAMLAELEGTNIKAVAIGGIKSTNLLRTLHGSVATNNRALDGVAVVSDIVASTEPKAAAERLQKIFQKFKQSHENHPLGLQDNLIGSQVTVGSVLNGVVQLVCQIREINPLVHQITNTVVATQSANITLSIGASPIMATEFREMADLARICSALLVNIGTIRHENVEGMLIAGVAANSYKKPVVFDPVGVGATSFRKETVRSLLDTWQASVIKGNAGELAALAGTTEVLSKGVDSVGSGFKDPEAFVKDLARRERCVVVLTGATDYISDGTSVVSIRNGDEILGRITGSGCMLGSCIASYCAVATQIAQANANNSDADRTTMFQGDMFTAAIAGVLVLTVAAEIAVKRDDVKGPGTFLPALIDVLWALTPEQVRESAKIIIK
ncbi:hypothetical protein D9613_000236 [Agrocybe pediades]|uniref:Thiamine phosphate synthase/TenI domain-containing protein n=1 Tax=Agrocybe pediades TaxID=84607 RepID=A0A8H4R0L4_9AGAR|nr:hypothetical protein D9613_000236 [Agrocybe pediades]